MKYIKIIVGASAVVISFILLVLIFFTPDQKETVPELVLSYAENQTKDYPTTMAAYKFADMVEERTEGRIKILVQAEGELGDEKSIVQQMQFGGIDFTRVSLALLSDYVPELTVLQMPYLYSSPDHMWKVLDGEIGDEFKTYIDQMGLVGMSWFDAGARNFYNAVHPITSLESIEGMHIRVQESGIMIDTVEALGAVAVPLDYADVYSGIQQGKVDGAENNWPSYEAMDHYEVARYFTLDEHIRVPEMQICSGVTWEKLKPEDQEIIRACAEQSALYERQLWQEREVEARRTALANGVEVSELSEAEKKRFQEAVITVYEKYCSNDMDVVEEIMEQANN